MKMHIWIFSYNRGVFLQNCVESVERCAPMCELTVFDDNSTDTETQAILSAIAEKHRVLKPRPGAEEGKHGGLYANMQSALELMPDDELMCCLQDDTQLVRAIVQSDIDNISDYFSAFEDAAFVQLAFMRGRNRGADEVRTRFDLESGMYFVDRYNRSAGTFYSDIFIASVNRLRGCGWRFEAREKVNESQAKTHFRPIAYMRNPFAAWLPNVPAFRGKVQTWAMRRAQQLSKSGFYPLDTLSEEDCRYLLSRDVKLLPYAEDFLRVRQGTVTQPWCYYPLQNYRWLKRLSHIEVFFRRQFRR